MIRENLDEVRAKVAAAAVRSGRDPKDITLIAVSKTKPVPMLLEAYGAGARDFGENKVQEILDKHPQLPQDVRWHMIGHLQRNKVHQVLGKAVLIHSVDSLRLAEQIEVLSTNGEYYTVKKNMDYGLSVYDHIVLDADTVTEGQIIY